MCRGLHGWRFTSLNLCLIFFDFLIFLNIPVVAGAFLQKPSSLIHSLIQTLMLFLQIFKTSVHQTVRARELELWENVHPPSQTCHMSGVRCQAFYKTSVIGLNLRKIDIYQGLFCHDKVSQQKIVDGGRYFLLWCVLLSRVACCRVYNKKNEKKIFVSKD